MRNFSIAGAIERREGLRSSQGRETHTFRSVLTDLLGECVSLSTCRLCRGTFAEPNLDSVTLIGSHLPKEHAHTANTKPEARMEINHLAGQFKCAFSVANPEEQFRTD